MIIPDDQLPNWKTLNDRCPKLEKLVLLLDPDTATLRKDKTITEIDTVPVMWPRQPIRYTIERELKAVQLTGLLQCVKLRYMVSGKSQYKLCELQHKP